jgi:dTDP-4-amino-4,6-dideoxygalactose transaminase
LKNLGIPSAAYYPMPMHTQEVYGVYPRPGGLPVSEAKAKTVLSLPMHPYLDVETQGKIIDAVRSFNG